MTANDKLLIFHQITPRLQGRARRYTNGCPHRADDILAAAADLFVGRLRERGGEGQMVALGKLCLAEAARAERKEWGGERGVYMSQDVVDPRPEEEKELTRRESLERQIEWITGMSLAELAANCAKMGRMQRKRLIDALRRKLGVLSTRRQGGVAVRQGESGQLDLFGAAGRWV